jgi:hypothetical protein
MRSRQAAEARETAQQADGLLGVHGDGLTIHDDSAVDDERLIAGARAVVQRRGTIQQQGAAADRGGRAGQALMQGGDGHRTGQGDGIQAAGLKMHRVPMPEGARRGAAIGERAPVRRESGVPGTRAALQTCCRAAIPVFRGVGEAFGQFGTGADHEAAISKKAACVPGEPGGQNRQVEAAEAALIGRGGEEHEAVARLQGRAVIRHPQRAAVSQASGATDGSRGRR